MISTPTALPDPEPEKTKPAAGAKPAGDSCRAPSPSPSPRPSPSPSPQLSPRPNQKAGAPSRGEVGAGPGTGRKLRVRLQKGSEASAAGRPAVVSRGRETGCATLFEARPAPAVRPLDLGPLGFAELRQDQAATAKASSAWRISSRAMRAMVLRMRASSSAAALEGGQEGAVGLAIQPSTAFSSAMASSGRTAPRRPAAGPGWRKGVGQRGGHAGVADLVGFGALGGGDKLRWGAVVG